MYKTKIVLIPFVCALATIDSNRLYQNNPFLVNVIPNTPQQVPHQETVQQGFNNVGHVQQPNKNEQPDFSHNPFLDGILPSPGGFIKPTQSTVSADFVVQDHPITQIPIDKSPPVHTYAPAVLGNYLSNYCLKPRGQFPGRFCNSFINCWDGNAFEQFCNRPLLFNPISYNCDYPHNVDCRGHPITDYPTYPTTETAPNASSTTQKPTNTSDVSPVELITVGPSPIPTVPTAAPITLPIYDPSLKKYCLKPRGQFPGRFCNSFINCWDGNAVEQFCARPLLFNPILYYCDYPYNVYCQGRPITEYPTNETTPNGSSTTQKPINPLPPVTPVPPLDPVNPVELITVAPSPIPTVPTAAPITLPIYDPSLKKYCLKPRGQFPGRYCNSFINCWDGYAVEQFCARPLLFNPVLYYCDYPYNVYCQGRPIKDYPTNETTPNGSSTTQKPINPSDVSPVELITVGPSPIPTVPTAAPITLPISDPSLRKYCLKPRGQFPSTRCNKYVNCWDDIVIEQECPHGLLFSRTKFYCDFPYNVVCHHEPRNDVRKVNGPPIDGSSCTYYESTFRDPIDCSSYYLCKNDRLIKLKCDNGFKFNAVTGTCDHERKVDCTDAIELQYSTLTNSLGKMPTGLIDATLNCEEGKVYPLNRQCTSVSICRENVIEIVHCPIGFAYDMLSNKCLTAELIKCIWNQ